MTNHYKIKLSIGLIWLFTLCGLIGILSPAKQWFLMLTPLNLLLSFILVLVNIENNHLKAMLALSIPFIIGFVAEALGVNYSLIFGTYEYGANLGAKIMGVPIIICFNWAMLTAVTADVSILISKNKIFSSAIGAALMTMLDLIIEVSAPRFDFWEFENGVVPIQNYFGWFFTAFLAHVLYQSFKIKTSSIISWHLLISITLFFGTFLFF